MLRAVRKVLEYAQGATRDSLPATPMRLDAVLYEVVVLGEATCRLSAEIRAAHPDVPWREIVGLRSIVTHGYDQIDDDELFAEGGIEIAEPRPYAGFRVALMWL